MASRDDPMTRCHCAEPKPFTITEERERPAATFTATVCDRCGGDITEWKPEADHEQAK